jgi:hypothetical protein
MLVDRSIDAVTARRIVKRTTPSASSDRDH